MYFLNFSLSLPWTQYHPLWRTFEKHPYFLQPRLMTLILRTLERALSIFSFDNSACLFGLGFRPVLKSSRGIRVQPHLHHFYFCSSNIAVKMQWVKKFRGRDIVFDVTANHWLSCVYRSESNIHKILNSKDDSVKLSKSHHCWTVLPTGVNTRTAHYFFCPLLVWIWNISTGSSPLAKQVNNHLNK